MGTILDWQELAALGAVVVAAGYLLVRAYRAVRPKADGAGCGSGCGGCGSRPEVVTIGLGPKVKADRVG